MSYTNKTANYELPQWVGTDRPSFTTDFNNAFATIDEALNAKDMTVESLNANFNNYVSQTVDPNADWNSISSGNYNCELNNDYQKVNRPSKFAGYLFAFTTSGVSYQFFVGSDYSVYFRLKPTESSAWGAWNRLSTETDLKNALDSVDNQITNIESYITNQGTKIDDLTTRVTTLEKNTKLVQISFAPYRADGDYKIPANSSKNFSLAIRSEGYSTIPTSWHCIGITEMLAGLGTTFTIHGVDIATKWNDDNTSLSQRLSVTFRNDSSSEQTISSTNAVIEALFMTSRDNIEVPAIKADYR